jgi:hypothetical protein
MGILRNLSSNLDTNDDPQKETGSEMIETVSQTQDTVEVHESAWESAKNNPKVILYSVGACASSMLWGFDIGMCWIEWS